MFKHDIPTEKFFLSKLLFPVQGWLTDAEASMLFKCAHLTRMDIMEIGPYCGKSTIALLCGSELGHNVPVWSIDRFDSHSTTEELEGQNTHDIFWDNICERDLQKNLRVIPKSTYEIPFHEAETFELGMLFHDAGHSYEEVKYDLDKFLPQVINHGFVCIHDFNPDGFPGVVKAVSERSDLKPLGLVSENMWVGMKC